MYQFLSSLFNTFCDLSIDRKNIHFLANAGIDADSLNSNTGSRSDNDSDDGLPPLEKNMNHLSLGETDDESEWRQTLLLTLNEMIRLAMISKEKSEFSQPEKM